jgi:hypothetical protein
VTIEAIAAVLYYQAQKLPHVDSRGTEIESQKTATCLRLACAGKVELHFFLSHGIMPLGGVVRGAGRIAGHALQFYFTGSNINCITATPAPATDAMLSQPSPHLTKRHELRQRLNRKRNSSSEERMACAEVCHSRRCRAYSIVHECAPPPLLRPSRNATALDTPVTAHPTHPGAIG